MEIVNLVCSGDLHQSLDLTILSELGDSISQYNPAHYHGAYLKIGPRKITLYKSGKYIIYGLKSLEEVDLYYNKMVEIIRPFFNKLLFSPPKIQNIVMMEDINQTINLIQLIERNTSLSFEYEPEQFPGLIYKTKIGTALIFSSGKVIFSGLKCIEDGSRMKESILKILE